MRFANSWLLCLMLTLCGCGTITDDLAPSNIDKRPPVTNGTTGPSVGQYAPPFILLSSLGDSISLSKLAASDHATVLYFTMWCPICDAHMSRIRSDILPLYPNVNFLLVDYVSGSVSAVREAEVSNGYAGPTFTVLADTKQSVLNMYAATMGTTVIIDSLGIIRMNEDFKDGVRMSEVLERLLQ